MHWQAICNKGNEKGNPCFPRRLTTSAAPKIASRSRIGRAVKRAIFVPFHQAALRPGRRKRREAGFVISLAATHVAACAVIKMHASRNVINTVLQSLSTVIVDNSLCFPDDAVHDVPPYALIGFRYGPEEPAATAPCGLLWSFMRGGFSSGRFIQAGKA